MGSMDIGVNPKAALPIPVARVRDVLRYDPETGHLWWKVSLGSRAVAGRRAGNDTGSRGVRISIDGVLYPAHRLAWAIMTGDQPPPVIDHRDMNDRNNAWSNLREADCSTNGANRLVQKNNLRGVKGVSYKGETRSNRRPPGGGPNRRWCARLAKNGKVLLRAFFATEAEARAAYETAAKLHFGEFARTA